MGPAFLQRKLQFIIIHVHVCGTFSMYNKNYTQAQINTMMNHLCGCTWDAQYLLINFVRYRHILAVVHFNFNLQREVKHKQSDGTERVRISFPKFKNGEATVRNIKITPNFGKCKLVG